MAVVQYTFTNKEYIEQHNRQKKYIEQHNRQKQYTEQHNSLIRKSADRAPSLRGVPWHFPYVFNSNQHTSALAYSVFVSVIRTQSKQFSVFKSHLCAIKFSSKNWIHMHIGRQITGDNRNPSLPNFHWCQWFAIPTVRSHGSQV